jgi:hypothetical protein|tara:strand:- start:1090 stop:1494 length:405 start_codon:yes stop_codon:yes gene_type:complete
MGEEENNEMLSLVVVIRVAGTIPILLGIMMIFNPTDTIVNGDKLTEYGLIVGRYAGILAIIFGLSHWVVSIYTSDNLHIFARFFAFGHLLIGTMDLINSIQGNIEFDAPSIIASTFPFALGILLIMSAQTPKPN